MPEEHEKVALITGASRGLGAGLAEALAPTHHIVAVARTTGALEEIDDFIRAAGGRATLAPMDITNADAMAQLCRSIHDRWGRVDLWAHTAIHAPPMGPADHLFDKDWQKSVDINLNATARLISYVAPLLGPGSRALFFDDPRAGERFFGAYGATKGAQIALARSWAAEHTSDGPEVRILTPRPLATGLRARFFPGEDRSPLITPREGARAVLDELGM